MICFSLSSITCPGSLGIISARYLEHPVRQCKDKTKNGNYNINLKIQNQTLSPCVFAAK